ncbi:SusC/RagA family TonB-linked outer membrane protein [Chitinophaga pendula]|uniref:SusC/RagA family TonB-linked outer membrane protein n=1 Tax=Chitinophaga TaxID=79328 RepID=UPI000BB0ACA1|nr:MULTISPECIES: SusC/RagA family TonB-linked outer membrane protein [Chitinophaga]ASZ12229.1 SusC/RagA family protein [Chitinophaga sp. MD30]UCJ04739.1 SusC/RagA family TonB-linked outer membrane protein [Chitinophaga pendula]
MHHSRILCLLCLLCIRGLTLNARQQPSPLHEKVSLEVDNQPLLRIIHLLEQQTSASFAYPNDILLNRPPCSIHRRHVPLHEILQLLFPPQTYTLRVIGRQIIIKQVTPQPAAASQVNGTVRDASSGLPLPGATISAGNIAATVTDTLGMFSLRVPLGTPVSCAYIGYHTATRNATQEPLLFEMSPGVQPMNTVVVTALGLNRSQRSLGYALADIDGRDITTAREVNPLNNLSAQVAGLDIYRVNSGVGGATKVTLRGPKIIGGNNQPLFVIDGVPIDNSSPGQAAKFGGYDLGDGSAAINPDEIATISVLKGGAAAALYGSRASNGVILITTKKGSSQGLQVTLSANTVVEQLNNNDDFQEEYGSGRDGILPRDVAIARDASQTSWGPRLHPDSLVWLWNGRKVPYRKAQKTSRHFFRQGLTTTNAVTAAAGNQHLQTRLTYTHINNKDIIPRSNQQRHNISVRTTAQPNKHWLADIRMGYANEQVVNRPALSDYSNNIGYVLSTVAPNIDLDWLKSYKDPVTGNYINWNDNVYQVNPYWAINEQPNDSKQDRITGFVLLKHQWTPDLYLQGRIGIDYTQFHFREFMEYSTPFNPSGMLTLKNRRLREINNELLLHYGKQIGHWQLTANAGLNRMDYIENVLNTTGRDINIRGIKSLYNFKTVLSQELLSRKRINSAYAAFNISYQNWLFLDITGRKDWSSSLTKGHRGYFYPSASVSFVFSDLLPASNVLSFGKWRCSLAQTGTDAIDPYQLTLSYGNDPELPGVGGFIIGGVAVDKIPATDLRPGTSRSIEAGLQLNFWKDRISLDLSYYHTNTIDQVLNVVVSPASGYTTAVINAGKVENRGVEAYLSLKPVATPNFKWELRLNAAQNRNRVNALNSLLSGYHMLSGARWGNASIVAKEGAAYGMIMGRKLLRDPQGRLILDAAGLPGFENADTPLGNGYYNWTAGITNQLTYKNLSLSILLDIKQGGNIYSMTNFIAHARGRAKGTVPGRDGWANSEKERIAAGKSPAEWIPTGGLQVKGVRQTGVDANGKPVYNSFSTFVNPQTYWQRITDNIPEPFVYDASFVKIRQLTLDYHCPPAICRQLALKELTVSLIARNPFTLYKAVPNIDPESSYNNGDGQGLEYGSLPTRRSYGINLCVKF